MGFSKFCHGAIALFIKRQEDSQATRRIFRYLHVRIGMRTRCRRLRKSQQHPNFWLRVEFAGLPPLEL
ncbi:MAG: hypothetical protein A3H32_18980 [Betaproteobacteria bacterium RIFCSPLOWO2_02_FULL_63_19]|nr:MAG: hypothetical protein A3H32_18980 [Betaproteobacteria bacterium RIFCSPLOWO2_02_FULL_63_19]